MDNGIAEGPMLVTGGTEMPEGLPTGYHVIPTVFAEVTNDMVIAQEEIFGPVLSMIKYTTVDEAIEIANDTPYGLAAAVWAGDKDKATTIAARIKAGECAINGGEPNFEAPFGGYKEPGNGREFGVAWSHEYCELKALQLQYRMD